ncbi:MAG: dihydroorotate dehydrogenase [Alphaproteobacteria bacterium HGW-Alphaproteobacteria-2]|nr:MAG: dihydroorotate dehydrogenase [Alphaproteobacteria bacterium HGW-Alphaproteobacteria-2]
MTQNGFEKTGDDALDAAFAAARAARPQPSAALMAAIRADAAREAAAAPRAARPRPAPARASTRPWAGFWRALGGWPSAGTLAASLVLGIAIGGQQAVPLAGLDILAPASGPLDEAAVADLLPGIDAFLTEG